MDRSETVHCDCDGDGRVTVDVQTGLRMTKAEQFEAAAQDVATRPCWRCNQVAFGDWYKLATTRTWSGQKPWFHDAEVRRMAEAS